MNIHKIAFAVLFFPNQNQYNRYGYAVAMKRSGIATRLQPIVVLCVTLHYVN
jgi:hypothetical protein